jgi:hypothetical protein
MHWVPAVLSLRVKRPGREADHSLPSSDKVKNAWSCTSIHPHVFMMSCLIKQLILFHGLVLSQAQGELYLYHVQAYGTLSVTIKEERGFRVFVSKVILSQQVHYRVHKSLSLAHTQPHGSRFQNYCLSMCRMSPKSVSLI